MFLLYEPSEEKIPNSLRVQRGAPFAYAEVGATRESAKRPGGYEVDYNRARIGHLLARGLQRRFARDSMRAMMRAVR